jgi:hypothetical protein
MFVAAVDQSKYGATGFVLLQSTKSVAAQQSTAQKAKAITRMRRRNLIGTVELFAFDPPNSKREKTRFGGADTQSRGQKWVRFFIGNGITISQVVDGYVLGQNDKWVRLVIFYLYLISNHEWTRINTNREKMVTQMYRLSFAEYIF